MSIEQIIKECWTIYEDKTGKWTKKNKIDTLKLIKDTIRTKVEILQQGPINLSLNELQQDLRQFKAEQIEPARNNFFMLPSQKFEDLR